MMPRSGPHKAMSPSGEGIHLFFCFRVWLKVSLILLRATRLTRGKTCEENDMKSNATSNKKHVS
jgi:hypothetical protein